MRTQSKTDQTALSPGTSIMIGFGFAWDWLRSGGTSFINQSKSKVKSTNKTIPDYFQD